MNRILSRSPGGKLPYLLLLVCLASFACTLALMMALRSSPRPYTYTKVNAAGPVTMHVLRTTPDAIGLKAIEGNVTKMAEDGINGGFFWQGYLLSIAVKNDHPVKGNPGDYGSGWYNIDRPRGTLVWDGRTRTFSVQVVDDAGLLQVTDRSNYWAQGGVSMSLGRSEGWERIAEAEEMPAMDEKRMRSAVAYDRDNRVWLLVSPTPCTVAVFREAVRETVGRDRIVDGVFLDGDGSSQLKAAGVALPGDRRAVYQMITVPRS
ncbi:hypothetical protein J31TS4_13660 [Paenibacillus sp. J31TS4]|uniref:hypothetical protein n=1 Tax=Paenibacillus sp. J31TS4 TaxID=2807195 RepID=UPI001B1A24EF|nr:hypothetical protein [Paenibacillus sp. J31TS4]GIP38086.1 hypothetical protein J31TS4_13660 [Paenibacillus sp. J31TS4]